jgi:hypothetical protein
MLMLSHVDCVVVNGFVLCGVVVVAGVVVWCDMFAKFVVLTGDGSCGRGGGVGCGGGNGGVGVGGGGGDVVVVMVVVVEVLWLWLW